VDHRAGERQVIAGGTAGGSVARRLASQRFTAACAPRYDAGAGRPLPPSVEHRLTFENSTVEPVTLYLAERGSEWFVGYVQPGETAALRLPSSASRPAGREFSLVAVPVTARRSTVRENEATHGAIRIEQLPGDYLTAVRWRLAGRWLVALPLAAAP
jgi:hypothetical protein